MISYIFKLSIKGSDDRYWGCDIPSFGHCLYTNWQSSLFASGKIVFKMLKSMENLVGELNLSKTLFVPGLSFQGGEIFSPSMKHKGSKVRQPSFMFACVSIDSALSPLTSAILASCHWLGSLSDCTVGEFDKPSASIIWIQDSKLVHAAAGVIPHYQTLPGPVSHLVFRNCTSITASGSPWGLSWTTHARTRNAERRKRTLKSCTFLSH